MEAPMTCLGASCLSEAENETLLREFAQKYGDPRVESWPLMGGMAKTVYITMAYLLFVKVLGPLYMRGKKPYDVKTCMLVYNVVLVSLSSWMFWKFGTLGYFNTYNWRCEPVNYSNHPDAINMAFVGYVYYLSKFLEYFDTLFFILRKKYNQITTLHVYHHATVSFLAWYSVKYACGGYNVLYMMLNVFVHIWMYSYYGLSGLGPEVQKYLWWKKYLTKMQIVQFVIIICHVTFAVLFPVERCKFNLAVSGPAFLLCAQYLYLFSRFYAKSYSKKALPKENANSPTVPLL